MSQNKKHKIIVLGDDPLSTSGVGIQTQMLIRGLVDTGKYSFKCLGGALKHTNYQTKVVNQDFVVKPIDGFGSPELLREILITEKPDCILMVTDPRQFEWVWGMRDEIIQVCPLAYWTIWDNDPYPNSNKPWYDSTDLLNCISRKTYDLVHPNYPEKTNYIPHAFPESLFFPFEDNQIKEARAQHFGDRKDWFIGLWINRNAHRKMPGDLMLSWKLFLDKLQTKYGHKNAFLVMHTDPNDINGPNLLALNEHLGCGDRIVFSTDKIGFDMLNLLHNMSDFYINISYAEGFGLGLLQSLMTGTPVVALKTGGMTEQVIDDNGNQCGVGLDPTFRSLRGTQTLTCIYEDYVSQEDVANGLMKLYERTDKEKQEMRERCLRHAKTNFSYDSMITNWDKSLQKLINSPKPKAWDNITITSNGVITK